MSANQIKTVVSIIELRDDARDAALASIHEILEQNYAEFGMRDDLDHFKDLYLNAGIMIHEIYCSGVDGNGGVAFSCQAEYKKGTLAYFQRIFDETPSHIAPVREWVEYQKRNFYGVKGYIDFNSRHQFDSLKMGCTGVSHKMTGNDGTRADENEFEELMRDLANDMHSQMITYYDAYTSRSACLEYAIETEMQFDLDGNIL